ncbi:RNA polymerase sigma-70 factor [Streptoalloteichus hindustanus]|uniref:RNA polymerase sigma-70 factor n=1 Tax=Streptoalloteichus hindustanus TaxID=2017 RepID=UPI00093771C6|nr:RNA polymerase sigma-70 factor [Streptoalloteichus hindustanus]
MFEEQRPRLVGLAYRLLGSASEAEDVVQDAFLRWNAVDPARIEVPAAWLTKVVTNLCLNQLTSARVRRERYVGPWLPEPVLTEADALGPLETVERRDSVSVGMLVLLERLTPPERAVFVLREAFGHSHREIAQILDIEEAHSRQLHRRARQHVGESRPRFTADSGQHRRIVERFLSATLHGDVAELERLLAADVVSWADGGGVVTAARRPVLGRDNVSRYLLGLGRRPEAAQVAVDFAEVNGQPAALLRFAGHLAAVITVETAEDRIIAVRSVFNPEKLGFLARQLA